MNWKKRISALALTLCMAVSLSVPALAAETVRRPVSRRRRRRWAMPCSTAAH